jgi:TetR/AcrR family transcriptional regulator
MSSHLRSHNVNNGADNHETVRMSGEERRRQLIRVAITLFSRKGFRGTTTKEIALAAGISEAMIFRHFASKEELYSAILDFKSDEVKTQDWVKELREYVRAGEDEKLFRTLGSKLLDAYGYDYDFLRLLLYSALEGHDLARLFREKHLLPIFDFMREYILQRQAEGIFKDFAPDTAVRAFLGMVHYHAMVSNVFRRRDAMLQDEDAVAVFTQLMLNGLRCEPAADRREKRSRTLKK